MPHLLQTLLGLLLLLLRLLQLKRTLLGLADALLDESHWHHA